nr:glycosyltransferase [uncultured Acetatifactor sp.]
MNSLVSIIVPVYNVENFLEECINSIRKQTYRNIEIILVNDGSTDSSGLICHKHEQFDQRIKVIDKQNGGLSSARNMGIEAASGEILSFIDSDDFIEKNMIELLVTNLLGVDADISCCNYDVYNESSRYVSLHFSPVVEKQIYSSEESVNLLLREDYFKCYAWNKVYKKKLFDSIRYPEGRLFEDIITSYYLLKKSDRIVFINLPLYHYRERTNSITKSKFNEKKYDILQSIDSILLENKNNKEIILGCIVYYLYFIDDMILACYWDENVYRKFRRIVKVNMEEVKRSCIYNMKRKGQILLCVYFPNVYRFLYRIAKCSINRG